MNINPNPKRILIFGDSYTFGKVPAGGRFSNNVRFAGIVQENLGEKYEVIEEGLRGRFLSGENPFFPYRNGLEQFGPIFGSHVPVELLILFLGTNDANSKGPDIMEEVVRGYDSYFETVRWWCKHFDVSEPKVMIMIPPNIEEEKSYEIFKDIFKGSDARVRELRTCLMKYAEDHKIPMFDCDAVVKVSPVDGIHLDADNNKRLGKALAKSISYIL